MKDLNKKIRLGFVMASLVTGFFVNNIAIAQTQCKGLESTACNEESMCTWVASYERKDGIKVNAFCRAKPKSKSTTAITPLINKQS